MSDRNQIGYKNPPKHTRFQKGKSGNPKGRPKKKKSADDLHGIMKEIVYREHRVRIDDKVKKMKSAEILLRKIYKSALDGNIRDAEQFLIIYKGSKAASKKFKLKEDEANSSSNTSSVKFVCKEWRELPKRLQKEYAPLPPEEYNLRDIAIKIADETVEIKNSNKKIKKIEALAEVIVRKAMDLDHRALKLLTELMPASEYKDPPTYIMCSTTFITSLDEL